MFNHNKPHVPSAWKRGRAFNRETPQLMNFKHNKLCQGRSPVVLQGAAQHEERQPDGSAERQRHESCKAQGGR